MTTGSQSVLKRKVAAARQGERGPARSALRALRLALARAAASETGLSLAVIGATQSRRARDDLAGAEDLKYAAIAEQLAGMVLDGKWQLIHDAAHAAHLQQPRAVVQAIEAWLPAPPD